MSTLFIIKQGLGLYCRNKFFILFFILLAILYITIKAVFEYYVLYDIAKIWSSYSWVPLEQFYSWFAISISAQFILNAIKYLLESIIVAYLLIKFAGKKATRKFKLILNIFAIFLIFGVLLYIIMPAGLYILALNSFMQTVDILIAYAILLTLIAQVFGYLSWFYSIKEIGPIRSGIFSLLVPVAAYLFSYLILGLHASFFTILGSSMVLIGIFLLFIKRK